MPVATKGGHGYQGRSSEAAQALKGNGVHVARE